MQKCYNCGSRISDRNNANVLAFLGLIPRIFCNNCYSKKERDISRHILYSPRHPINGRAYLLYGFGLTFLLVLIGFPIYFSNIQGLVVRVILLLICVIILSYYWLLRVVAMGKIKDIR